MKKRSFLSQLSDFNIPDDLLKMSLYDSACFQAIESNLPFNRDIFENLCKRADSIDRMFGSDSYSDIARRFSISLEWQEPPLHWDFIKIFSYLIIEKRKIILYPSILQDLFLFLRKFVKADLKFEAVAENALFHELCHYADFCHVDNFSYDFEAYSEITVNIYLDKKKLLGIYPWFADILFKGSLMHLIEF